MLRRVEGSGRTLSWARGVHHFGLLSCGTLAVGPRQRLFGSRRSFETNAGRNEKEGDYDADSKFCLANTDTVAASNIRMSRVARERAYKMYVQHREEIE